MKIKNSHRRDFSAYIKFNRRINKRLGNPLYFCPDTHPFGRGDGNTIQCFVEYESTGKMKNLPKEPRLLQLAFDGKKILNWHIKQWAEGLYEGFLLKCELEECLIGLPDWVKDCVYKQEYKLIHKKLNLVK